MSETKSVTVPSDVELLKRLPPLLLREGYIDAIVTFGPLQRRRVAVGRSLDALPKRLQTLVRLFFLGLAVPSADAQAVLGEVFGGLRQLAILLERDGEVWTGGLTAIPVLGLVMLVPMPVKNPNCYFGEDSAALAFRLQPKRRARCIDFCSGPGIQALRESLCGGPVVSVEINPIAAACAELNVALNDLEDQIEVRCGDLYAVVKPGEQFDFVSANPPLLPFPPDVYYPFVGHGGADGLSVTRRILHGLPEHLAPGGTAQIIGTCLGDDNGPHPAAELSEFAKQHGMQVIMTLPSRTSLLRGATWFHSMAWTAATSGKLDQKDVEDRFEKMLQEQRANWLYFFYLNVTAAAPNLGIVPSFAFTKHYEAGGGFWFR